jgi:hypothetical protein
LDVVFVFDAVGFRDIRHHLSNWRYDMTGRNREKYYNVQFDKKSITKYCWRLRPGWPLLNICSNFIPENNMLTAGHLAARARRRPAEAARTLRASNVLDDLQYFQTLGGFLEALERSCR